MVVAALVMGSVALVLALFPFAVTKLVALLLGLGAAVLGYLARREAVRHGRAAGLASVALGAGVAAVFLSGLIFLTCNACSGDGEVDPALGEAFKAQTGRAFEQARKAHGEKTGGDKGPAKR